MAPFTLILPVIIIASIIPQSISQSYSPQNIQTSYPLSPPPPPPPPPSPPLQPPPPNLPPPPPRKSSTRAAVGKAIGATAATTLVISGVLFFILLLYSRHKKNNRNNNNIGNATITNVGTGTVHFPPEGDNFTRFSGNLKGVIVDENGLDVLYWRNLQQGAENTTNYFKKQSQRSQRDEPKRLASNKERTKKPPTQEVPLLRGKSSSSQSPVWGQKQDQNQIIPLQKPPSIPSRMSSLVETNQGSSFHLAKQPSLVVLPKVAKPAPELPLPPPPPPSSPPSPSRTTLRTIPRVKSEDRRFEGDLMEAMFGYIAAKRKSPRRERSGRTSQIFIIDAHKSQDTAAVIKSLSVSRGEIINALEEGRGLNADTIKKLTSIAPSKEEVSQILTFHGDPARLAEAESFLYHLLKAVPSAFARFTAMDLKSKYELEISRIKENLESLESACKELTAPGLFPKLLEAVLKAGNRLGGNADRSFDIGTLKKLSDIKSSDGKTTLLQFVVQEVVRAEGKRRVRNANRSTDPAMLREEREREYMTLGLPVISGLTAEFPNVKKAAALEYDVLIRTGSILRARAAEIRETTLAQCDEPDGAFARAMEGFLKAAEAETKILMEDQVRAVELAKRTTNCYPSESLRRARKKEEDPLRVFAIMRDFLQMVDHVCADIEMEVEMTPSGSSSPAPESPRVFRFPKLPAGFAAEEEDENEDDLEVRQ